MKKYIQIITICLGLLFLSSNSAAQENDISKSRKLDEFGFMRTDPELARLDLFANELMKDGNLRGYIVGYNREGISIGQFLRRIYGYQNYLVNKRGFSPDVIKVIAGGNNQEINSELWLVPKDETLPAPKSELKVIVNEPLKFDTIKTGVNCEPEFTVSLYELNDALKIYADELRRNEKTKALILVYPKSHGKMNNAIKTANEAKSLLIRNYQIKANRIKTKISSRRECLTTELWLLPG
jgi:hypothetical protein